MARETRSDARVACEGPSPTVKCRFFRGAGACPPRVSGRPQHGEGQALALREREPFFHRSAGALGCHTRIRAGFPREQRKHQDPNIYKKLLDKFFRSVLKYFQVPTSVQNRMDKIRGLARANESRVRQQNRQFPNPNVPPSNRKTPGENASKPMTHRGFQTEKPRK